MGFLHGKRRFGNRAIVTALAIDIRHRLGRIAGGARHGVQLLRLRPFDTATPEGRADERHRRAALSALASAGAKVISVATALISVPLALHYLGVERYGMWMVISSFTMLLAFADLGMGNGILNAVADAYGRDDRSEIRNVVSSGFVVLSGIALTVLAGFAVAYPHVAWHRLFNVETDLARQESGPALAAFICCFALAIPLSIVQRVQSGLQQGFSASLWQCLGSILGLTGVLFVIHAEGSLGWLVLALAGAPLIAAALNTFVFFGFLRRDLAPRRLGLSRQAVTRIARTGLLFFVLQIVVAVAYGSDNIIIAQALGAPAVSDYAVPERMFSTITMVLSMALAPLWPAYGEALARGDHGWVKRTLVRSIVISVTLAAILSAILVVFGSRIIALWVGHAVDPPFLLLLGLGVWKVIEAGGGALAVFLNGANVVKLQVVLAILTGATALSLKLFLVTRIGTPGVVWATITAFLVFSAAPYLLIVPGLLRSQNRSTGAS